MKQLLTLILALVTAATVTAVPIITAKANNGNWNSGSTWNLNRKPQDGDTIVIPINFTVAIKSAQLLNNIYLRIVGSLELDHGTLTLNTNSKIILYGHIFGHGQGNNEEIKIGNVFKYNDNVQS